MPASHGTSQFYPPHQFVGYWGSGNPAALDQQLNQSVSQSGITQVRVRRGQGQESDAPRTEERSSTERGFWAIAYLGLEITPFPALQPAGETPLAALFAGGLAVNLQADGSVLPDAWVSLSYQPNEGVQLVLGRDRFGRVPLYWMRRHQVVWFASQMQLLLPLTTAEIDPAALYGYTCFSYVPTPLTPIQGIQAIPAGVQQIWQRDDQGEVVQSEGRSHYWQELEPQIHDEPTAISDLQNLLKSAVSRQIVDLGDAPVGVFLSGGLDSSIIAALLVQMGVKVRAYSLNFGLAERSELNYAKQVAQFLQIPLVVVDATPSRIRSAIAATATALDLPFGDGVTVPLFLLNQAAAEETVVVFNGEHGDQLFAGWANKPLIAAGLYSPLTPEAGLSTDPFYPQYLKTFHRLHGHEHQIFQPELVPFFTTLDPLDWLKEALDPQYSTTLLHRLRRANLMLKGAQNIQPRATALAFAHGLRVRSPFCDAPLADWTFRLAGELCLRGSCEKYILKRAVEAWLPSDIVWRSKRGMGVPLTAWCLNELWHDLGDWLNPAVLRSQHRWQPDIATQLVAGNLGGDIQGRRIGECLWLLLMWQAWRRVTLDEARPAHSWNHPFWLPPFLWHRLKQWQLSS